MRFNNAAYLCLFIYIRFNNAGEHGNLSKWDLTILVNLAYLVIWDLTVKLNLAFLFVKELEMLFNIVLLLIHIRFNDAALTQSFYIYET